VRGLARLARQRCHWLIRPEGQPPERWAARGDVMLLAKVVGTVVSTRKDPKVEGFKFLLLKQVNPETLEESGFVVANDAVGCGVGEYVLYASGSSARQTEITQDRPCDAVIMAIVDTWEIDGKVLYEKHSYEHGVGDW